MTEIADEAPILLVEGQHCLHDPGYKTGVYYCLRQAGHLGRHEYVPDWLATLDRLPRADAEPAV